MLPFSRSDFVTTSTGGLTTNWKDDQTDRPEVLRSRQRLKIDINATNGNIKVKLVSQNWLQHLLSSFCETISGGRLVDALKTTKYRAQATPQTDFKAKCWNQTGQDLPVIEKKKFDEIINDSFKSSNQPKLNDFLDKISGLIKKINESQDIWKTAQATSLVAQEVIPQVNAPPLLASHRGTLLQDVAASTLGTEAHKPQEIPTEHPTEKQLEELWQELEKMIKETPSPEASLVLPDNPVIGQIINKEPSTERPSKEHALFMKAYLQLSIDGPSLKESLENSPPITDPVFALIMSEALNIRNQDLSLLSSLTSNEAGALTDPSVATSLSLNHSIDKQLLNLKNTYSDQGIVPCINEAASNFEKAYVNFKNKVSHEIILSPLSLNSSPDEIRNVFNAIDRADKRHWSQEQLQAFTELLIHGKVLSTVIQATKNSFHRDLKAFAITHQQPKLAIEGSFVSPHEGETTPSLGFPGQFEITDSTPIEEIISEVEEFEEATIVRLQRETLHNAIDDFIEKDIGAQRKKLEKLKSSYPKGAFKNMTDKLDALEKRFNDYKNTYKVPGRIFGTYWTSPQEVDRLSSDELNKHATAVDKDITSEIKKFAEDHYGLQAALDATAAFDELETRILEKELPSLVPVQAYYLRAYLEDAQDKISLASEEARSLKGFVNDLSERTKTLESKIDAAKEVMESNILLVDLMRMSRHAPEATERKRQFIASLQKRIENFESKQKTFQDQTQKGIQSLFFWGNLDQVIEQNKKDLEQFKKDTFLDPSTSLPKELSTLEGEDLFYYQEKADLAIKKASDRLDSILIPYRKAESAQKKFEELSANASAVLSNLTSNETTQRFHKALLESAIRETESDYSTLQKKLFPTLEKVSSPALLKTPQEIEQLASSLGKASSKLQATLNRIEKEGSLSPVDQLRAQEKKPILSEQDVQVLRDQVRGDVKKTIETGLKDIEKYEERYLLATPEMKTYLSDDLRKALSSSIEAKKKELKALEEDFSYIPGTGMASSQLNPSRDDMTADEFELWQKGVEKKNEGVIEELEETLHLKELNRAVKNYHEIKESAESQTDYYEKIGQLVSKNNLETAYEDIEKKREKVLNQTKSGNHLPGYINSLNIYSKQIQTTQENTRNFTLTEQLSQLKPGSPEYQRTLSTFLKIQKSLISDYIQELEKAQNRIENSTVPTFSNEWRATMKNKIEKKRLEISPYLEKFGNKDLANLSAKECSRYQNEVSSTIEKSRNALENDFPLAEMEKAVATFTTQRKLIDQKIQEQRNQLNHLLAAQLNESIRKEISQFDDKAKDVASKEEMLELKELATAATKTIEKKLIELKEQEKKLFYTITSFTEQMRLLKEMYGDSVEQMEDYQTLRSLLQDSTVFKG